MPRTPLAFFFAALASLWAAACSSANDGAQEAAPCEGVDPTAYGGCVSAHYFGEPGAAPHPDCAGTAPSGIKVDRQQEIQFFKAPGVTHADATTEGHWLARYYAPYGLGFFTSASAKDVGFVNALEGTNAELDALVRDVGVAPGGTPTAAQEKELNRRLGDLVFRSVRAFVQADASPAKARVDVVVLKQIASPDIAKQFQGGTIAGIGISPRLLTKIAAGNPDRNLYDMLALPEAFTPLLLVGHEDIVKLAKNPEGIVAHELGHALGLEHSTLPGDLMNGHENPVACVPALTDAQVEDLKKSAQALATDADDALASESLAKLGTLRRSLIAGMLRRNGSPAPTDR